MTCPVCLGVLDPHRLLFETLCEHHMAEAESHLPNDEELLALLERGARESEAVRSHTSSWPPRCT